MEFQRKKLVAIALHYDLQDLNCDGKVTTSERVESFLFESVFGLQTHDLLKNIGLHMELHGSETLSPYQLYLDISEGKRLRLNAERSIWLNAALVANQVISHIYFGAVFGRGINEILTNAGVTGVQRIIYQREAGTVVRRLLNSIAR